MFILIKDVENKDDHFDHFDYPKSFRLYQNFIKKSKLISTISTIQKSRNCFISTSCIIITFSLIKGTAVYKIHVQNVQWCTLKFWFSILKLLDLHDIFPFLYNFAHRF